MKYTVPGSCIQYWMKWFFKNPRIFLKHVWESFSSLMKHAQNQLNENFRINNNFFWQDHSILSTSFVLYIYICMRTLDKVIIVLANGQRVILGGFCPPVSVSLCHPFLSLPIYRSLFLSLSFKTFVERLKWLCLEISLLTYCVVNICVWEIDLK